MTDSIGTGCEVTIQLPRVLADMTACERRIFVTGNTVGEALEDLVRRHPSLGLHLYDDTGTPRGRRTQHELCVAGTTEITTMSFPMISP